jgi:hypothetical protein
MDVSVFANNRLNSGERIELQAALRIVDHTAHHVGQTVNGNLKSRTRSLSHRAADLPKWLKRGSHAVLGTNAHRAELAAMTRSAKCCDPASMLQPRDSRPLPEMRVEGWGPVQKEVAGQRADAAAEMDR